MSDAVLPSSPVANAVERKSKTVVKFEEEEEVVTLVFCNLFYSSSSNAYVIVGFIGDAPKSKVNNENIDIILSCHPLQNTSTYQTS